MPKDTGKTRKPREKPGPYVRKPKVTTLKDVPKTSAKPTVSRSRQNLTLADWLTVFKFMDTHPHLSQGQVVDYFGSCTNGALVFQQCTLSRKLAKRAELEDRINSHPNALSSKHVRVVTRPDVKRALILWVHHMESKGETVTGPMLREKRKRFEDLLKVPDTERLCGEGWLSPFCRAYKIKGYKRHGEAGSADPDAVEVEQKRVQELMKKFAPEDQWNFDETSLFPR
jgi:hypothetical protein